MSIEYTPMVVDMTVDTNEQVVDMTVDDGAETVEMETDSILVVRDYSILSNKPAINEHELRAGENTLNEIGIGLASAESITNLF